LRARSKAQADPEIPPPITRVSYLGTTMFTALLHK
jgi:hypothetical protein